jgi:hypothetical protein
MLDRLANRTLALGNQTVTEIDTVKPRFKALYFGGDFRATHHRSCFDGEKAAAKSTTQL